MRFLARLVDHTLSDGWHTPEDFLRHFPPPVIIASLSTADDLRVRLLVATTGTHEKIALKKSVGSAAEDLALAIDERTTTAAAVLGLYPVDDRVRYLDAKLLWRFVVEGDFYRVTASQDEQAHARAVARLTFILDCALSEGILTLRDVADGMTIDEISASLPVADLREVVKHALQIARADAPLTEERFLAVVPLAALVSHVVLEHTWQRVVVARIAVPAGFVEAAAAAPSPARAPDSVVDIPVTMDSAAAAAPAPAPAPAVTADPARTDEDEIRRRVIERLRLIDRLPPATAELSTAILLSIESMYAELWAVSDDDEREACIRESFPNQALLRTAMLGLIELLDPTVDTHDPIIRDADVAGLVKIVLFEERRRRDASPATSRRTAPSQRSRRSVPPPLPRSSVPPPFPGDAASRGSTPPALPAIAAAKRED
jgi:hypothetical protein